MRLIFIVYDILFACAVIPSTAVFIALLVFLAVSAAIEATQ